MHDLNYAIASSKCQPILPWSIPEALGLNVCSILDLKTLPFALVAFIRDKGTLHFKVLLQLQVSPAMISERGLPPWIIVTRSKMFCWRQAPPITSSEASSKKEYWLLQFSTQNPKLLTLFLVQDKMRKPVATFNEHCFLDGIAYPNQHLTQMRVQLQQAYPDEIIHGSCDTVKTRIATPPSIVLSTSDPRAEALEDKEAEDSSDEEEDRALPPTSVRGNSGEQETRAADEDGPTAEDADAAEALTIFLMGSEPDKASSLQLLHLGQSIVPHSWGCIKFDLSKPLLNLMSVLFARTVLQQATSPYVASVPTLKNIELWYLTFVANIIASVLLPLSGLPSLGNFASLLGALVSPDFWLIQLKYALFKGPENSLP
jgi:hypothetical protein